ncbi:MAG: acyltransferase [Dysgonamonadaceae bacterium]|jgi:hypothetical protein|nr:acyltransferase [Dysgonamonadaceae bacterium]
MLKTDMNHRQMEVMEAMRFLLVILILFIHMLPERALPVTMEFSSMGIYRIVSEGFSHNVGHIAVPCFFLFSGFFFFYKMDGNWTVNFYLTQLKKRGRTLLIPYLLWNLLCLLAIVAKNAAFHFFALETADDLLMIRTSSWYELLWSMPVNYPLWYCRDLICMIVLSPLFFFLFRYAKIYGLLLLMGIYLSGLETNIPGFGSTAFFFFGGGAFVALNRKNILLLCSEFRYSCALAAFIFLCIATYYTGTAGHIYAVRIFVIFGIITAVNLTEMLARHEKWKKKLCRLSVTTFFVYAIHEIYIINWLKGYFSRTALAGNGGGMLLSYFLTPCICLIICLALYYTMYKISPHLLSVLTGGRMTSCNNHGKNG